MAGASTGGCTAGTLRRGGSVGGRAPAFGPTPCISILIYSVFPRGPHPPPIPLQPVKGTLEFRVTGLEQRGTIQFS